MIDIDNFDFMKDWPNACADTHPACQMDFDTLYSGIMKEVERGCVTRQVKGDLEIFKYNMFGIYEHDWTIFSLVSRGIILCPSKRKIVALAFPKFFNYLEKGFNVPDLPFEITTKVDGCCDQDTKLITQDGDKTIKEICETKYQGDVLSFDLDNNMTVWDAVIGHSILPNTEQWYELETENGEKIKLTGNHLVYLPELNCYRRVDQLEGNEKILLKK